ncbi:hypothetical protein EOM82_09520 [bacterium]|nr:hypothetical protein [bacterium]
MKKDIAKPILFGSIYLCCIALFVIMSATRLGAVKLSDLNAGYGMFDAKLFYTPQKFYEILLMLGADGRTHYLQTHIIDYAFLTLFAVVQFTILGYFFNKLNLPNKLSWLFLPVLGEFFADIAENVTIDILIRWTYPVQNAALVRFASAMTILKYIFLAAWFVTVVALAVKYFVKKPEKAVQPE